MDLDPGWAVVDDAEVEARKVHTRRLAGIADLLGRHERAAVIRELTERCQVVWATARGWVDEAWQLRSLPHITAAYAEGSLSTDQVSALRVLAEPGTDADWLHALHQLRRVSRCRRSGCGARRHGAEARPAREHAVRCPAPRRRSAGAVERSRTGGHPKPTCAKPAARAAQRSSRAASRPQANAPTPATRRCRAAAYPGTRSHRTPCS
jgi:hypothetical protein